MKSIFLIVLCLLALCFQGCDKCDVMLSADKGLESQDIVLQERASYLPEKLSNKHLYRAVGKLKMTRGIGNSDRYLGYSYNVKNSIIGDPENIGQQVIDIDMVHELSPKRITTVPLNKSEYLEGYYEDVESYEQLLRKYRTYTTGFSLNIFGLLKLGHKHTHTKFFKDSITSSSHAIYGEVDVLYKNSMFSLLTTSNDLKYYSRSCISPFFLASLYSSTIGNVLDDYGQMVVTGYITGGRAYALYAGMHRRSTSLSIKTKDLGFDVNASIFWDDDSIGAKLHYGNGSGSATRDSSEIMDKKVYIKTLGGAPHLMHLPDSALVWSRLNLDLSDWWKSLSDVNNHTIIDVANNGLFPLSAFVLETNFKRRIEDTANGMLYSYKYFTTPYIEIVRVLARDSPQPLYEVAAVLNTRHGDKIVLSDGSYTKETDEELRANMDNSVYDAKVKDVLAMCRKYFPVIKIVKNYGKKYDPSFRDPLCIRLDGFDGSDLTLHRENATGMVYLYNRKHKIALSYYAEDGMDDAILYEAYEITDWIDSIPHEDEGRSIPMSTLSNYTIIGL